MKKAACRRLEMHLGEEVDIIPYFLGNVQYEKNCHAFCLSRMPLCVAVPVIQLHELQEKIMLPYGIYYAQTPSPEVVAMLERFRKTGVSGEEKDAQWTSFL